MNFCIELEAINKSFKKSHVVKDLTLKIPKGKITGFLGPNGSGKTTSMKIMSGLLPADSGSGRCCGFDLKTGRRALKACIGYMPQYFSLWDDMSVEENLLFLAKAHKLTNPRQRIDEVIEQFGLEKYRHHYTRNLSGGWCQRTSLAATLIHRPELILLDEPTAGVDPSARRAFWKILHELADAGTTILVSTHYMDEAERCQHLVCMAYGSLLATGSPAEIISTQQLTTYAIRGPNLARLENQVINEDVISQTTIYGNRLYITSNNSITLAKLISNLPAVYDSEKVPTSLEDSFTQLMKC